MLLVAQVLSICRQAEQVFNHKHHFDFLMAEAMEVSSNSKWARYAKLCETGSRKDIGSQYKVVIVLASEITPFPGGRWRIPGW